MPMFDYKCNSCGHKFDKLVPFSESEKILSLPGLSTLWTTADLDEDGKDEFLVLVDGDSLYRLILHDGELVFSDPIASGLGAVTPVGWALFTEKRERFLSTEFGGQKQKPLLGKQNAHFGFTAPSKNLGWIKEQSWPKWPKMPHRLLRSCRVVEREVPCPSEPPTLQ